MIESKASIALNDCVLGPESDSDIIHTAYAM